MRRGLLFVLALLVACSDDHAPATGVLLEISAPDAVQDATTKLRVRVSSGPEGELVERGDETVDVSEWPAEVFVRATDVKRVWSAEVWALDEGGAVIGAGAAEGGFERAAVPHERVRLMATQAQPDDESDSTAPGLASDAERAQAADAGDAGTSAHDAGGDAGKEQTAMEAGALRDATTPALDGASANTDGGAVLDGGHAQDAGATPDASITAACANTSTTYTAHMQGTLMRPDARTLSLSFTFNLVYTAANELGIANGIIDGLDSTGARFWASVQASFVPTLNRIVSGGSNITLAVEDPGNTVASLGSGRLDGACNGRGFDGTWSFSSGDRAASGQGTWTAEGATCAPSACANDCSQSGPIRCCTSGGACGCAWAPDTLCQ